MSKLRGRKHFESKTKLFERWASMHARCKPFYYNSRFYFDKGITVCHEWTDFMVFKKWAIDNGFDKSLQLDRRDNDKGYCSTNCRWITQVDNNLNRSNTIFVIYNNKTIALAKLCETLGLNKRAYSNALYRISKGWSIEDAIHKTTVYNKKNIKT